MDKTVVEQKIYKYKQGEESKTNTWTIGELKNAVVNSESINKYYKRSSSIDIITDTSPKKISEEKWRKCETYTYYGYEIYASNRGRIKVNGKICTLYEEISKNPKKEEYKEQLTKPLFNVLIKNQENHIGYLLAKIPDDIKRNANHEYFGQYVYRMVADAWLINKNEKRTIVHHITNDGYDNRPENLIWVSGDEHNQIHYGNYGKKDDDYQPRKYDEK